MSVLAMPPQGPTPAPGTSGDWLGELVGARAARVLTSYAVPCLHYAHWQALWRYRLAEWTNETTYGTDRYHCLCETLGRIAEDRLPRAKVHRPKDRLGTPFTIGTGRWLFYSWRYGDTRDDPYQGLRLTDDTGIRSRIVGGGPPGQQMLEYEGLPPVPLSNVIVLAWAGNRHEGLTRAFLASPRRFEDHVYWQEDRFLELDVEAGRRPYGLRPPPEAAAEPDVPPPPEFDLELVDRELGFADLASGDEATGTGD